MRSSRYICSRRPGTGEIRVSELYGRKEAIPLDKTDPKYVEIVRKYPRLMGESSPPPVPVPEPQEPVFADWTVFCADPGFDIEWEMSDFLDPMPDPWFEPITEPHNHHYVSCGGCSPCS
jgi:hypothetical protein